MSVPFSPDSHERMVGQFQLGDQLGFGAQGRVFYATEVNDGTEAAVKLYDLPLEPKAQDKIRRRVRREVETLRQVTAPAIVRVLDSGEYRSPGIATAGYIWVAFEYVKGRDLSHMMTLSKPPAAKLLGMLRVLAAGLDLVHARNTVHRDIKPSNVLLRGRRWEEPVLVDFGYVLELAASRLTRTGLAVGSEGYIAPEVLRDPRAATPASDQWSFVRLAMELLCWSADVEMERHTSSFTIVSELDAALEDWPQVAAVLRQGFDEEPGARYANVSEFVTALDDALHADGVIEEEEPEETYPFAAWDRRRTLHTYLEQLGFRTIDRRSMSGALWVLTSQEEFEQVREYLATRDVHFYWAPNGSRTTSHQPAWFTKSVR